jgi:putative membrane protein
MTNLILTVGHHLLVFSLLGLIVAERAMMSGALAGSALRRLRSLDGAYGLLALAIIAVGVLRVFFGLKGPDFYLPNPFFWAKMASFVAVGLLSIVPTVKILAWHRSLAGKPDFAPAQADVARVKQFVTAELLVFPLIPIFAAIMALGYGLS